MKATLSGLLYVALRRSIVLPKPPLQLTDRLSTSLLVLTAIFAVAGCDRVEGQLNDAAYGAVEGTSSFAR